ncbi:LLM class flavin-dependent oxidoreductase, partial [Streptococcus pneumoniae]|nr:LLM class flavin-dependent oxidoreductase [Streptococcus pneumoniae]
MTVLNILDYSPIDEGETAASALRSTAELAKLADRLGYKRYWVAEHHQVFSVAGSSPEMLMMHLATLTERLRIGSGGVMLPHYSA